MTNEDLPPWSDLFSQDDLNAAIKIFSLYAEHVDYHKHAQVSPDIAKLFDLARRVILPSREEMKDRRRKRKQEKKNKDREVLAVSGIRQMRKVKMVGYLGGSVDIPMPPRLASKEMNEDFATKDDETLEPPTTDEQENANGDDACASSRRHLTYQRGCHVCGVPFRELHHFYDQLCPSCAEFNFTKRFSEADMRGRVCIVTGARVKIGYCIALKLLRMGATVIGITRFPHDCANRYAREPDFTSFKGRLAIYGLDLRDIPMLHHFCRYIRETYQRLDVIINNAAQTVRRPALFYQHLIAGEANNIDPEVSAIVDVVDVHLTRNGEYMFRHGGGRAISAAEAARLAEVTEDGEGVPTLGIALAAKQSTAHLQDVNISAALSQVALVDSDHKVEARTFPPGLYDRDDQQLDLRSENSWTQQLGEISSVEMMECHVINTFAPWVIISELKPLMEKTVEEGDISDKFIVNVSAMEGQFYRNKTIFHPHTNMAKAALNMMTRTASAGLAAVNIFMTAVDTGWITDENPVEHHAKREEAPPPLDEWDAAMRVLDPVLAGVRGEELLWGVFLKNYKPTRW